MKPTIHPLSWYIHEYGEDWAEIVREEDQRLGRNSDGSYPMPTRADLQALQQPSESWAAHPINMQ
jgi:hypothetical protein